MQAVEKDWAACAAAAVAGHVAGSLGPKPKSGNVFFVFFSGNCTRERRGGRGTGV